MIPLAEAAHEPIEERQTVMDEDIALPFDLPAVARKKVSAAFDGTDHVGRRRNAARSSGSRLGVAERLAAVMPDGRDASRVIHLLPDILRARIFAIACGYEDADDLDRLQSNCVAGISTPHSSKGVSSKWRKKYANSVGPQSPSSTARKCWVKRRSYRRASAEGSAQREEAGAPSDACFGAGCPLLVTGESAKNHAR